MARYAINKVPSDWKIKITHFTKKNSTRRQRFGKDWLTIAYIYDENNVLVGEGMSMCSKKDNPSRKIGRNIAVGRAVQRAFATHHNVTRSKNNAIV